MTAKDAGITTKPPLIREVTIESVKSDGTPVKIRMVSPNGDPPAQLIQMAADELKWRMEQ